MNLDNLHHHPENVSFLFMSCIFLQRKHTDGQEGHEKMFNIANYYRNANQNYNEISLHTSQNDHIKKSTNNTCWRGCGEKGTLLHCWWECKLVQSLWRIVLRFLKKLKIELPYDPVIPLMGIYLENNMVRKDICTPVFSAVLLTIAKTRKQPNFH